jgi:hypothetical protein
MSSARVPAGRARRAERHTRFHPVVAAAQIIAAGLDCDREVRDDGISRKRVNRPRARRERSGETHQFGVLRHFRLDEDGLLPARPFGAKADDAAHLLDGRKMAPRKRAFV